MLGVIKAEVVLIYSSIDKVHRDKRYMYFMFMFATSFAQSIHIL